MHNREWFSKHQNLNEYMIKAKIEVSVCLVNNPVLYDQDYNIISLKYLNIRIQVKIQM